jgi:hypothetical protein
MSGFHTATICADCDPPVVAISTGSGSRCPKCGQVEAWSLLVTDTCDTRLDGALARQIIADTAIRSDGDARLLGELAGRLLDRVGKGTNEEAAEEAAVDHEPGTCLHCLAGEPSVWDDVLFHYAHPAGSKLKMCHSPWRARCRRCSADVARPDEKFCARHDGEGVAPTEILTQQELDDLERHLDDETEWETVNEFWNVWGPRVSDRLQRLIATVKILRSDRDGYQDGLVVSNNAAERRGQARDRLSARVEQLEKALGEALGIAEYEASEYQGKREHLARLPQLREVLAAKVTQP